MKPLKDYTNLQYTIQEFIHHTLVDYIQKENIIHIGELEGEREVSAIPAKYRVLKGLIESKLIEVIEGVSIEAILDECDNIIRDRNEEAYEWNKNHEENLNNN